MIDLHSHILPGIDDGAPDMTTAVAMARQASASGIHKIVATPHVDDHYDTRANTMKSAVAALNQQLAREAIPVEVLPGAEVAAYRLSDLGQRELGELGLGGGPYLLIEAPLSPTAGDFEIFLGERAGFDHKYVLAHPERSPTLQRDPERLKRLVLDGMVISITAGSLSGRFGGGVRRFSMSMLAEGMVHNIASDMHDLHRRPPGISGHLQALAKSTPGFANLEQWLTAEVPAAVIAGQRVKLPPKLSPMRRRRFGIGRVRGARGSR
ncbi:MAG TPA: CpsB/CapC family capsule biosynthesis tyrosine phosphatase [Solirubrobacteraceae bacterium]|nr:CpsB/CapC family capsule biosynthesis tyrosine phosphatase [Solirubrobacteraceae bacterium]